MEAELTKFGVSPKQASKARQAMYRSADQAGFFLHGRDRLVEPPRQAATVSEVRQVSDAEVGHFVDCGEQIAGFVSDPLIVGLWKRLPDPDKGTFTPEQQAAWLNAAKVNLQLLYGGVPSNRAETSRTVELKSVGDTIETDPEA